MKADIEQSKKRKRITIISKMYKLNTDYKLILKVLLVKIIV